MTDRRITCRYVRRNDERCTGEVLDPNADVLLCAKHTARVLAQVQRAAVQRLARQKPAIRRRTV